MSDEKPTEAEKPAATDEVEGHSFHKPTKPTKPTANDDVEVPDIEGHSMGKPTFKPTKPV